MRSDAPPLLPIFRSQHQADLLALLFLHPHESYTLADLARRLGVGGSTLHRDVQRLIQADLISVRTVGRAKLLTANTANRITEALTRLLIVSIGPQVIVADEFSAIRGVQAVAIFGSWAARYHGEPGPPPNDIDVLVVGTPDRSDVYDAADRTQQRVGFPVNPVIRSPERWREATDPLIQQVKTSPLVITYGELPMTEG